MAPYRSHIEPSTLHVAREETRGRKRTTSTVGVGKRIAQGCDSDCSPSGSSPSRHEGSQISFGASGPMKAIGSCAITGFYELPGTCAAAAGLRSTGPEDVGAREAGFRRGTSALRSTPSNPAQLMSFAKAIGIGEAWNPARRRICGNGTRVVAGPRTAVRQRSAWSIRLALPPEPPHKPRPRLELRRASRISLPSGPT
jgi:hypothetical protein